MNELEETTLARSELNPFSGKGTPPRLPVDAVLRMRLLHTINEQETCVLLVSAPVGFGKSTLLAQLHGGFVAQARPAAWLTLDARDNDLGRFLLYLREAAIQLGCPEVPPLDIAHTSREVRMLLERQSQDLVDAFARLTQPCLLVFDDFEKLTEPAVIALVQALGNQFGHGQCMAIGSRTEPELTLATWRSQGRLQQVAVTDLRFEAAETSAFLQRQVRLELGPEQHSLLHERTDGWPGAVRLAALALEGVGNPTQWLLTLTGGSEDMTAYLVENVLAQQTPARRDFLIGSSVMEVFDAAACDHVLQLPNSQEELSAISHANLFLTGIDAQGQWFQYHSIFREFLLRQLQRQHPQRLPELQRRAARWFAQERRFPQAMALALDSGDTELAASVLDECAMDFVRSAWLTTLESWLDALPRAVFRPHHKLLRARAYTMIAMHRHADALEALEDLRGASNAADSWEVDVQIVLLYSWMDRQNEVVALRDSLLARFGMGNEQDVLSRGIFCNVMIYTHCFSHDLAGARSWLPAAKECVEQRPDGWSSSYTLCFEGMLDLIEGHPSDALQRLEQACSLANSGGAAAAAAFRATALYELDRLDEAAILLEQSLAEIKRSGAPDVLTLGLRTAARIAHHTAPQTQRHVALLNELIDLSEARQLPRLKGAALLEKSHLALLDGDVEAAAGYLAQGSADVLWAQTKGFRLFAQEIDDVFIASARLAIAIGNGSSIVADLESAVRQAQVQGRRWRRLRLQSLLAQALSQSRRRIQALTTLEDALVGACPGGYVRAITDCPWCLHELLATLDLRSRRVASKSIAQFIEIVRNAGAKFRATQPAATIENRLTSKELTVLTLASVGNANKAIAHEMGISDNTVETHLRHIYTKLGTRNRTQAVEQARNLGFL